MKFDILEKIFVGKSVVVIENGNVNIENLRKLRISIDKLKTRLRQVGISSIEDVASATIEPSGMIGYALKENKRPLIKDDFIKLINNFNKNNDKKISVKKKARKKQKDNIEK